MKFTDKRVLVAGLARSGLSSARLLYRQGATVIAYDAKKELPEAVEALRDLPIALHLGEDPTELMSSCDLAVISPGISIDTPWIVQAKEAGKKVIGELELGSLLSFGTMIAITGTNGKTTTTSLVGEMLKNAGKLTHIVGNIGTPFTSVAEDTHPEDFIVVEVSSFQLETIESFRPMVSAILNITEDHLNRHGTMKEYTRLKARIFENQRSGDFVALNWDDPVIRAMAKQADCKAVYFSLEEVPTIGAWVQDGQVFYGTKGEGNAKALCTIAEIGIPGKHNLQNALCAVSIAMVIGLPPPVIRHTLRSFAGVEHRLENVRKLSNVQYINDSKGTNVDATIMAIQAMQAPTVLIAGGYDKHTDFAPFAKEILLGKISQVVLLGQTADQIENALHEVGYRSILRVDSMEQAVFAAHDLAIDGGNVLLSPACASFDMYADFEARGRDFKEIVMKMA